MRLARNMISAPPVHRTPPRTDWYPDLAESNDMPPTKDSPHDVILKLDDVKASIRWLAGIVCALLSVLYYHSSEENKDRKAEIRALIEHDSAQNTSIAEINLNLAHIKSQQDDAHQTTTVMQNAQQNAMLQLTELRATTTSTSVNVEGIKGRLESVINYMRDSSSRSDILESSDVRKLNGYEKAK
jgi:hypothetical protein